MVVHLHSHPPLKRMVSGVDSRIWDFGTSDDKTRGMLSCYGGSPATAVNGTGTEGDKVGCLGSSVVGFIYR